MITPTFVIKIAMINRQFENSSASSYELKRLSVLVLFWTRIRNLIWRKMVLPVIWMDFSSCGAFLIKVGRSWGQILTLVLQKF